MSESPVQPGRVLTGPLFNEPMRVETVRSGGPSVWVAGLVGVHSERFRNVTLTAADLERLQIQDAAARYDGDGKLLRLGIQAYALGISEKFVFLRGDDIREQFGVNQWLEQNQVLTLLDLAKRGNILPGLRQVHWDLVIVDEAHRMSWTPPARKTARYALGELLRDSSDHLLLLTATPHKGDPANFSLFLQLLDPDAYADARSIREAMNKRRAPFYLRRTKEAMVYFPERQPDGSWVARKIFTKRVPHTADFQIDGAEFELYRDVTRFVKNQSARAAAQGDDPRARAVGFLMSLYQRRLA